MKQNYYCVQNMLKLKIKGNYQWRQNGKIHISARKGMVCLFFVKFRSLQLDHLKKTFKEKQKLYQL